MSSCSTLRFLKYIPFCETEACLAISLMVFCLSSTGKSHVPLRIEESAAADRSIIRSIICQFFFSETLKPAANFSGDTLSAVAIKGKAMFYVPLRIEKSATVALADRSIIRSIDTVSYAIWTCIIWHSVIRYLNLHHWPFIHRWGLGEGESTVI